MRPDGALALVAKRLVAVKRATPALKAFEWMAPGQRRFNLEALQIVRADLMRAGLVKVPVVAAHASCGAQGEKALEAARNLGATVAEGPGGCSGRVRARVWALHGLARRRPLPERWLLHAAHGAACVPEVDGRRRHG